MIYLDEEHIIIPNLLDVDSSTYRIELKNNATNEIVTLEATNDSFNNYYYSFTIDSSLLSQNEYTLNLYDDSSVLLGTFLAQKGISKAERTFFETDTEYIQFEKNLNDEENLNDEL